LSLYEIKLGNKKGNINKNHFFHPAKIFVISFAIVILIGSLLLSLPIATKDGTSLPYIDALFTATSAVCVTGLVVVDTGDTFSLFGQTIVMMLIQLGGLGFMTFASVVMLFLGIKISLKYRLILQENFSHYSTQGVVKLLRNVVILTLIFETIGMLVLGLKWYPDMGLKSFYFGLFHSISAFNNAGFDLFGSFSSLTNQTSDILTSLVIISLFIFGGLGFFVLSDIFLFPKRKSLHYHSKLVLTMTFILLAVGFVGIFSMEGNNPDTMGNLSLLEKIVASLFAAATPRTAGFSTIDVGSYSDAALLFTMVLMFIGASPGSTGGGIKTTTFGIILAGIIANIRGNKQTVMYERGVSNDIIWKASTIAFLALFLIIITTFVLTLSEHNTFIENFFESVSAFGTVGLSMGITPDLSLIGKIMVIITMFIGRVGPLTLALVLSHKSEADIIYPNGDVMIG